MYHLKEKWHEEMEAIRKVVSLGNQKVLSQHVLDMLEERDMTIIDLALVIRTGEIILGLDENEKCPEAYIKNAPGMHRLVLGKNSRQEHVVVSLEIGYRGSEVPMVEKIITVYSLEEKLEESDARKGRKLQIREFLKSLLSLNHEINDHNFMDESGRRVYFLEDGTPYVFGKDGRILTKFKGYQAWYGYRKTS